MVKQKVLLVEDDEFQQELTSALLAREDFDVLPAGSVAEAQAILSSETIDLVLLDLELPDEDGLVLARQLRAKSLEPPIIFLTARGSDVDTVTGLNVGGDDYITKPFKADILIARMHAVLRRKDGALSNSNSRIRIGYVEIDLESRQVWTATGADAGLTKAEFDVLMALVNANGRVLSRQVLLDAISNSPDHDAAERTVDALVAKIRKKIQTDGEGARIIATVQGLGYRLGVTKG